jgi:hypothetical protein
MHLIDDDAGVHLLLGLFPSAVALVANEMSELEEGNAEDDELRETMLYTVWPFVSSEILIPALDSQERLGDLEKMLAWIELCLVAGNDYVKNFAKVCPIERIRSDEEWSFLAASMAGPSTVAAIVADR